MKMEEYVPIKMPAEIVQAKSSMEGPPKKYRHTSTASVEREVKIVRESVWLMASFMICEALSFGSEKRRNSRMRSNTIILSLMEYPATVNNAPI